jgi:Fe-S-cluster containining protein
MKAVKPLPAMFRGGIRFECQGTGKCCMSRGEYGYVYFSADDRRRMAARLGITMGAFTRKYCKQTHGSWHLKDPEKNCVFLEGKRCSQYEGRPSQCRTWPFWPENMNARIWNSEVAPYCSGVGKGRLYSTDEIQKALAQAE